MSSPKGAFDSNSLVMQSASGVLHFSDRGKACPAPQIDFRLHQLKTGADLPASGCSPAFPEPRIHAFRGLCRHQSNKLLLRATLSESVEFPMSNSGGPAPPPEIARPPMS